MPFLRSDMAFDSMSSLYTSTIGVEPAVISFTEPAHTLPLHINPTVNNISSRNDTECCSDEDSAEEALMLTIFKITAMVAVMMAAVFGNMLVIISVLRYERLRLIANSFIVSLAFADLTVALLVMPFNASQLIAHKWVFGSTMCDIYNANDVLFSSASLLHLCCISMDRYIAITDPFHYDSKMTKRRVAIMLSCVWGASALISHIPIQLGWYTTADQRMAPSTNECLFIVNKIYGIISSTISFWTPVTIMVFTYVKIFREARKQEKQIHSLTRMTVPSLNALRPDGTSTTGVCNGTSPRPRNGSFQPDRLTQERRKMKREHKAAKTLGIIMGAFLMCWLPFFTWYVSTTMCGVETCPTPEVVVSLLFWVGYMNSAINPLIYACFNRDFRNAFKRLLCCGRRRYHLSVNPCWRGPGGRRASRRGCCCCVGPANSNNSQTGSENVALKPTFRELCSQPCNSRSNDSASSFQSNNNSPQQSRNLGTRTSYDSVH